MLMFSSKCASMNSRTRCSARGGRPPRMRGRNWTTVEASTPVADEARCPDKGCCGYVVLVEFRNMSPSCCAKMREHLQLYVPAAHGHQLRSKQTWTRHAQKGNQ